ncbi:hypothetical protein MMC13_005086 [Lambiella insularis]|nr:hypothetical protein [Lambiella insularis]
MEGEQADQHGPRTPVLPDHPEPTDATSGTQTLGIQPIDCEKAFPEKEPITKRRRVRRWILYGGLTAALLALILGLALHFGLRHAPSPPPVTTFRTPGSIINTWVGGPVVETNFADPALIEVDGIYYAFGTNKYVSPHPGQVNIQIAVSHDFSTWNLTDTDALPEPGNWTTGNHVWAPDVLQLDDGSFVMYYSAGYAKAVKHHCVGVATSKNVTGPYIPAASPLICPLSQGGAIDPDGFRDDDGSRYIVYKVDGNSLDNFTATVNPTPLMLQQVNETDGVTLIGTPQQLLDRARADGPLIEAPSLMKAMDIAGNNTVHVLFFSSNLFTTSKYDVAYATSTTGLKGPYTRNPTPLLQTGDDHGRLFGPGGLDVGSGGERVVFHSGYSGTSITRQLWTGQIAVNGTTVII